MNGLHEFLQDADLMGRLFGNVQHLIVAIVDTGIKIGKVRLEFGINHAPKDRIAGIQMIGPAGTKNHVAGVSGRGNGMFGLLDLAHPVANFVNGLFGRHGLAIEFAKDAASLEDSFHNFEGYGLPGSTSSTRRLNPLVVVGFAELVKVQVAGMGGLLGGGA